jgi:hypothetical protein
METEGWRQEERGEESQRRRIEWRAIGETEVETEGYRDGRFRRRDKGGETEDSIRGY